MLTVRRNDLIGTAVKTCLAQLFEMLHLVSDGILRTVCGLEDRCNTEDCMVPATD